MKFQPDFSNVLAHRSDLLAGLKQGVLVGAAALALTLPPAGLATLRPTSALPRAVAVDVFPKAADFGAHSASPDVHFVADWVADSRDNRSAPFAILDKRGATVYVFDAAGRAIGASPVLLGLAAGDDSVAGIGTRAVADVRPDERTTPAGRFVSRPGRNASGEDVIWVDYDAAVSMHRVRPVDPKERRLERLASADPALRRISYGCINVPVEFFESVVSPTLGASPAVVYVLPETKSVRDVFTRAYDVNATRTARNSPPVKSL